MTFTLSDLIMLGGLVGGWVLGYIGRIRNQDKVNSKVESIEKEITEHKERDKEEKTEFFKRYGEYKIHTSNGRKAEKKEIMDMVEKQIQTTHTRIDRVRDDNIKSYEKLETRMIEVEKKMTDNTEKIINAINSKK